MKRLLLITSTLCLVLAIGALMLFRQFMASEFPDVSLLKTRYPVVVYQGKDRPARVELRSARPASWVSLTGVSIDARAAILVSEDGFFWRHKGYDASQMREALREDIEEGRFARGASTITQQVVRNVYLDKNKNLWRKLRELSLSMDLEERVGKARILEIYLNIAEWGEGVYGITAAARQYFGKEPGQLTAKEGAFLAMLLPSPKRYSSSFRARKLTEYARSTISSILSRMAQAHYITEEERALEEVRPLPFEQPADGGAI